MGAFEDTFKIAKNINARNRGWKQDAAESQAWQGVIGQLGQTVPQVIGAFHQNKQNAALAGQLGLDPTLTQGMSNQDLLPIALKMKLQNEERARQTAGAGTAARILGFDTGGADLSNLTSDDIVAMARAKAYADGGANGRTPDYSTEIEVTEGSPWARMGFPVNTKQRVTSGMAASALNLQDTGIAPKKMVTVNVPPGSVLEQMVGPGTKEVPLELANSQMAYTRAMDVAGVGNQGRIDVQRLRANLALRLQNTKLPHDRQQLEMRLTQLDNSMDQRAYDAAMGREYSLQEAAIRNELDPEVRGKVGAGAEARARALLRPKRRPYPQPGGSVAPPQPGPTDDPNYVAPPSPYGQADEVVNPQTGQRLRWNGSTWQPVE